MLYILHWIDSAKKVHTMRTRSIGKAFASAMCNKKPVVVSMFGIGEEIYTATDVLTSNDRAMDFFAIARAKENINT